MSAGHPKVSLQIMPHSTRGPFLKAPPGLVASDHTLDFTCGACGTILMHAERDQVHNLNILCTECGSFNSTDIDAVELRSSTKGSAMPSSSDFRANAIRFAALARTSTDPEIIKNLQERERSSNELADNAQWLVDHEGHTVPRSDNKEIIEDDAAIDRWNAEGGLENGSDE